MALLAQGACPSCGAPVAYGVGASIAQVCRYCKAVVVRSDRDLRALGRVADLTPTTSLVGLDDTGRLAGRPLRVLGRVQLDHGEGPWDEWYVGFGDGGWGWLAYAQGNWYVTAEVPPPGVPPWHALSPEQDVGLGHPGTFRVAERREGRVVSAEGELPAAFVPNQTRYYADLVGPNEGFATLDYGDGREGVRLFVGRQVAEGALEIRPGGERPVTEVATGGVVCPNCGANVPALVPKRNERLACPHCNAVSDIAARRVIETQEAARQRPDIPVGSRGSFEGRGYVVCGYVERSGVIEGERFAWQEYLLFGEGVGFRWLVKDEGTWRWITPVNVSEIDVRQRPARVAWRGRSFSLRNRNQARVDYVLGEFYWKVRVGESVDAEDYIDGNVVLGREAGEGEVMWSLATPMAWPAIAAAFGLQASGPGARLAPAAGGGEAAKVSATGLVVIVVLVLLVLLLLIACGSCGEGGSSGGGGVFVGGGSRGGK
jgi:uncharacterized protein DUF4178